MQTLECSDYIVRKANQVTFANLVNKMLIPVFSFYLSKPQEKRHDRRLIGKSTQQRQSFVTHRAAKIKRETEGRSGLGHPPPTHGTVRHELPPLLARESRFKHTYIHSLPHGISDPERAARECK